MIASALALATHYYAVASRRARGGLAARRAPPRARRSRSRFAVVGLCGLALIPLALSQNATGHDNWIANSPLGRRLGQIMPAVPDRHRRPRARRAQARWRSRSRSSALVLLVTRSGRRGAARRAARRRARARRVRPQPGARRGGHRRPADHAQHHRAVAAGARSSSPAAWPRRARAVLGVRRRRARCARSGVTAAVGVAFDLNLQRPDWRAVARRARHAGAAGLPARAILIQHYGPAAAVALRAGLEVLAWRSAGARAASSTSSRSPRRRAPLCWWGSACNLIAVADAGVVSDRRLPRGVGAPRAAVHDHAPGRSTTRCGCTPGEVVARADRRRPASTTSS